MLMKFDNLTRNESFLLASLHNKHTYPLKLTFISICKTSNFCLLISEIISSPIWAQIYFDLISYFCSETIQLLVSKLSCSSLFIKEFRSLSQAKNVVSFAKLQNPVDSVR